METNSEMEKNLATEAKKAGKHVLMYLDEVLSRFLNTYSDISGKKKLIQDTKKTSWIELVAMQQEFLKDAEQLSYVWEGVGAAMTAGAHGAGDYEVLERIFQTPMMPSQIYVHTAQETRKALSKAQNNFNALQRLVNEEAMKRVEERMRALQSKAVIPAFENARKLAASKTGGKQTEQTKKL